MTDFSGVEINEIERYQKGRLFPVFDPQDTDPTTSGAIANSDVLPAFGTQNFVGITQRQKAHAGKEPTESWDKIIPGFYVSPIEINLGLITEESNHDILVWNSDPKNELEISQIQQISASGTVLTAPDAPITLYKNHSQTHKLQVLKEGPAVQNTKFIYTASPFSVTVEVTGQRVLPFSYEPNWGKVNVRFAFSTIIHSNKKFTEQRRPRIVTLLRKQTADYLIKGEKLQKFLNEYRKLHNLVLAIPIYTEPMTPTANIQGQTVISISEDISEYTHVNLLSNLVIILSKTDIYLDEVKAVDSVSSSSLTLDQPIVENFLAGDTVIYPCFIGVINSNSIDFDTDQVGAGSIEFAEIRPDAG